jgi:acyl-CoA-binding protein
MTTDLDTRFQEAVSRAIEMTQASLPQDVQLRLYAFYKQAIMLICNKVLLII